MGLAHCHTSRVVRRCSPQCDPIRLQLFCDPTAQLATTTNIIHPHYLCTEVLELTRWFASTLVVLSWFVMSEQSVIWLCLQCGLQRCTTRCIAMCQAYFPICSRPGCARLVWALVGSLVHQHIAMWRLDFIFEVRKDFVSMVHVVQVYARNARWLSLVPPKSCKLLFSRQGASVVVFVYQNCLKGYI